MSNMFRRHKAQILAKKAMQNNSKIENLAPERSATTPGNNEYNLLLAAMGEDLSKLHKIASTDGKKEYKILALEKYDDYIDGVISAIKTEKTALQDEIFSRCMIWYFDIGNYDKTLKMVSLMLKYGMSMPKNFNLPAGAWLCSNLGNAAEIARRIGIEFDIKILQQAELILDGQDIPDKHYAKLYKALGFGFLTIAKTLEAAEDAATKINEILSAKSAALNYFRAATRKDPDIGVVKEMERLERAISKAAETAAKAQS